MPDDAPSFQHGTSPPEDILDLEQALRTLAVQAERLQQATQRLQDLTAKQDATRDMPRLSVTPSGRLTAEPS